MARSEIIVGLDIGTTKICTVVGEVSGEELARSGSSGDPWRGPVGQVEILAVGTAPSTGLRKGVVVDIPATVRAIEASVETAERAGGVQIGSLTKLSSITRTAGTSCGISGNFTSWRISSTGGTGVGGA